MPSNFMIHLMLALGILAGCMREDEGQPSGAITVTGVRSGDHLGRAVARAGDLNQDGFSDIIVGAPFFDQQSPADEVGAAYILLGGPDREGSISAQDSDVILIGENNADCFGAAVAGVGDVNGDGFDDILVGAPRQVDPQLNQGCGTSTEPGAVYLFLGGTGLVGTLNAVDADLNLRRGNVGDRFGFSMAGLGDVNGDGYLDFAVGMPFNSNNGKSNNGEVVIYFGAGDINALRLEDAILPGPNSGDLFGLSMAGVGDVNGDGRPDLLVGAPGIIGNDGRCTGNGKAYLFFGGPAINPVPDVAFTGERLNDCFGSSVAGAGDVNMDGFDDVVIGAPRNDSPGLVDNGAAYLFFGATALSNTIPAGPTTATILRGERPGDFFGITVAAAGDGNGDGRPDLLVGATGRNSGTGMVYLFLGGTPSLNPNPAMTFMGRRTGDLFGSALAGAGDVDGDNRDDVIIGAQLSSNAGWFNNGEATIFLRLAP